MVMMSPSHSGIHMGDEFSVSIGTSAQYDNHKLGVIGVLPNGSFVVLFTTYANFDPHINLFSTQLSPSKAVPQPDQLLGYGDVGGSISTFQLSTTPNAYLISFTVSIGGWSAKIAHLWVSLDNALLSKPMYNEPVYVSPTHVTSILLKDNKIVTTWGWSSDSGIGGGTYYEILQANGTCWLEYQSIPCVYSVQLCLLSSGHFLINWPNDVRDAEGFPIQIFHVLDGNGAIQYADSVRSSYTLNHGLLARKAGGFVICGWQPEKESAFLQAFSENLEPVGEPYTIPGLEDIYVLGFGLHVAELTNGNIVVLFNRADDQVAYDLCIHVISPHDGIIYSNMKINSSFVPYTSHPRLLALSDDQFMVAWSGVSPGDPKRSILAKIFYADGSTHTDEFKMSQDDRQHQKWNVKLCRQSDTILACWESETTDARVQRVDGRFIFLDGTSVKHNLVPNAFTVHQNYPNPFNAQTTIQFDIPSPGSVDIHIYSVSGRLVYSENSYYSASGIQSIIWNGNDTTQRQLPSGVYVVKLVFDDNSKHHHSSVQKIVLNR